MKLFSIQPTSNTPIYQQIIDQVKEGILRGVLAPGDKLPSVRELATMMTVNPNTIQKAYQELERQKITETIQGKGTFIARGYLGKQDEEKLQLLKEYFKKGIIDARYLGLSPAEILNLVNDLLADFSAAGRESNC